MIFSLKHLNNKNSLLEQSANEQYNYNCRADDILRKQVRLLNNLYNSTYIQYLTYILSLINLLTLLNLFNINVQKEKIQDLEQKNKTLTHGCLNLEMAIRELKLEDRVTGLTGELAYPTKDKNRNKDTNKDTYKDTNKNSNSGTGMSNPVFKQKVVEEQKVNVERKEEMKVQQVENNNQNQNQ